MIKLLTIIYILMTTFYSQCWALESANVWYRQDVSTYTWSALKVTSSTIRMSLSDIRTEIRFLIKDTDSDNPRWTTAQLNRLINYGQTEISVQTDCLRERFRTGLLVGTTEYILPHPVLNVYRVSWLEAGDDERNLLIIRTWNRMDREYSDSWEDSGSGDVTDYYIRKDRIGFYPPPDSTATVKMDCSVKPDWMNNDTDYPFNDAKELRFSHYFLVVYVCQRIFLQEEKLSLYAAYRQEYLNGLADIKRIIKSRPGYDASIKGAIR